MPAIIYLLFTVLIGYIFVKTFTPYIFKPKSLYLHYTNTTKLFPKLFVVFPASFTIGVIFSGWLFYIPAYLTRNTHKPMLYGSIAAFAFMIFISVIYLFFKRSFIRDIYMLFTDFVKNIRLNMILAVFFCLVLALAIWLMTLTFFYEDGKIQIGVSVFSDFSVHTAIIRSFSRGLNFPTQFPHFPDNTMRYHFMFQFFTGALEYMGLRIDLAFNIMSIISFFNVTLLLYVTAVIITNKRAAGILTVLFFLFRSSFTGIRFLAGHWPYENFGQLIKLISENKDFIWSTTFQEGWGLWNLNVYANQRHFALGISFILFGIIAMLPLMKKMYYMYTYRSANFKERFRHFFLSADAWLPNNFARATAVGFLFGAAAFFHGSAVIAVLSMLAVMGLFSKHRLEFLIIALITFFMERIEAAFFAPGVELAKPAIVLGFIVEHKSAGNIAGYIIMLTGAALFLALLGLFSNFRKFKVFFLMFSMPFIITFTLSFTPDITVNHKLLMISVAFLNIFAAYAICAMTGTVPGNVIAAVLTALMISTGVIDTVTIQNKNGRDENGNPGAYAFPQESAYQNWLLNNTKPGDVFLTTWDSVNELFLTGRYEYFGWPYYAMSSGYDTQGRGEIFQRIVRPDSAEACRKLVIDNKISYIVINSGFSDKGLFDADVEMLKEIFPTVFSDPGSDVLVLKTDYNS